MAEEAVQEAALRSFARYCEGKADYANESHYTNALMLIAINYIRDVLRRRGEGPVPPGYDPPEFPADEAGFADDLAACLDRLDPLRREVFLRRYRDGERVNDIATAMRKSRESVYRRLSEATELLRDCMDGKGWSSEDLRRRWR
jgi:RNA polymerase sigma factor (sigma-70 family)